MAMNETLLSGNMNVSLPPYTCWSKNRSEKGGGGITTAVSQQFKYSAVGAGQGEEEDEYLITRFECFSPALNVINCYGEERKTVKEEVEKKWTRLKSDMEKIRAKNEFCLVAGDLNKLVGNGKMGVPGNHPEISLGGRLLLDLLASRNWILVNSLGENVVVGGPFTRKDPATGKMSCLDLFIVSKELSPYVEKLQIDCERKMPIARAVKMGATYQLVHSDHYTCLLTLTGLPRVRMGRQQKKTVWNLGKEGGWDNYKKMTSNYNEAFEKAIKEKDTIEEKMFEFEKLHDKIKFKAFGKVTLGKNNETKNKNTQKEDVTAQKLFEEEEERANNEIEEIKNMKLSKVGKVWELKKKIIGGKKALIQNTAILDPKNGKLAASSEQIMRVTLAYCKETLANNIPSTAYENIINKKKRMLEEKLMDCDGDFAPNKETFDFLISKFKKSRKPNYHFLVRASPSFQNTVFEFCKTMIEKEEFPLSFQETTLHMIFKGGKKGKRENLSDNRFIHSKTWWPRTVEGLTVVGGLKEPIVSRSSIYQVGGQPGHRSEELVFTMKSLIARQRQAGKLIILQTSDITKFFDKEMVEDALLTCYKRGADAKACRIWYKLNANTKIRVKTGAGMSLFCDVGAVVRQGTLGGALLSQGVLDEGISGEFTPGGEDEMNDGDVPMAPLIFQDNVLRAVQGIKEARLHFKIWKEW